MPCGDNGGRGHAAEQSGDLSVGFCVWSYAGLGFNVGLKIMELFLTSIVSMYIICEVGSHLLIN